MPSPSELRVLPLSALANRTVKMIALTRKQQVGEAHQRNRQQQD
jgi:hypothetical protein